MIRSNWPITEAASRPAGNPGECFYCKGKVGDQHAKDCVMRRRTVVCEVTIRMVRMVPEDWDQDLIEFTMNDGSGCFNNIINELTKQVERFDQMTENCVGPCFCNNAEGKYLREATENDEEWSGLKISDDTDK